MTRGRNVRTDAQPGEDNGVTHLKGTCQAEKTIPKARKETFLANIF
jgi:hypothetical protein